MWHGELDDLTAVGLEATAENLPGPNWAPDKSGTILRSHCLSVSKNKADAALKQACRLPGKNDGGRDQTSTALGPRGRGSMLRVISAFREPTGVKEGARNRGPASLSDILAAW